MKHPLFLACLRTAAGAFAALSLCGGLSSCSQQCSIAGHSSMGSMDGRMVYLRAEERGGSGWVSVDSCRVVHGRFSLGAQADTVVFARLSVDGQDVMPMVMEGGDVRVQISHTEQLASGAPLNDRLYQLRRRRARLEDKRWELDRECMRMIRSGMSPAKIHKTMSLRLAKLEREIGKLETDFILENADNPLGPGYFVFRYGDDPLPLMTPELQRILREAPATLLSHPFVAGYMLRARENSGR